METTTHHFGAQFSTILPETILSDLFPQILLSFIIGHILEVIGITYGLHVDLEVGVWIDDLGGTSIRSFHGDIISI